MNHKQSSRLLGAVLLGLGLCAAARAAESASMPAPLRKSIELPVSNRVFPGDSAGAKAANAYCLMCHSYGMVETQPTLNKAAWLVEVNKMRGAFKAPIPEDQVAVIADYIAQLKGAH